jgi:SAM-dependent methyltransferase
VAEPELVAGPRPATIMMQTESYRILFETEDTHWWLATRRDIVLDWVRRHVGERTDLRLLDVGCGTGRLLRDLRELGDARGVDASDEAIRFCQKRGVGDLVEKADFRHLPFAAESFDVVTAVDTLEHIADDVGALEEWGRVLRPEGRLLIFVPAHRWLWSLQDEVSGHQRRYTTRTLRRAIDGAGLRVDRMTYVSTLLFPVIFIGRLWLRILRRFREITTENDLHPAWSNAILGRVFRTEIGLLHHVDLPFGASILCDASRQAGRARRSLRRR